MNDEAGDEEVDQRRHESTGLGGLAGDISALGTVKCLGGAVEVKTLLADFLQEVSDKLPILQSVLPVPFHVPLCSFALCSLG